MRAFKYKLYPTKAQVAEMEEQLETQRRLYNNALAERRDVYDTTKKSVSYYDQNKALTQQRADNPYLGRVAASASQRTLMRLDKTFKSFFRERKKGNKEYGFPKFCQRGDFRTIDYTYGQGASLKAERNRAYFIRVGDVKVKLYRPVDGKPKTISFTKDAGGWWLVVVTDSSPLKDVVLGKPAVGIDLGTSVLATTSDGFKHENPKYYETQQEQLADLQRTVDRRKKGSERRKDAKLAAARKSLHIRNQRKETHHKVARELVNQYGHIAYEDLAVDTMVQGYNAKQILDAGWGQFITILTSKAESEGVQAVPVNPAYTSQTCSQCGVRTSTKLELSERTFACSSCGYVGDRDVNAAINIKNRAGFALQALA
jgi:putative transposase